MRRSEGMSGPFEWIKGFFSPAKPSGLPALPSPKKKSLIEAAKEKPKALVPTKRGIQSIIQAARAQPKSLISLPPELYAAAAPPARPPEKKVDYSKILAPERKSEGSLIPSAKEFTQFLKPSTVYEASRYLQPGEWPFGEPPLWTHTRWQMPTTMEIAEFVRKKWDLPGIYEYVLSQVERPEWGRLIEQSAHFGEPATLDVEMVSEGKRSPFDIANFLKIPDYVIESYGTMGPEGIDRFNIEVLQPLFDRVEKALEVFRPTPVLYGTFVLEPDEDMNFWLRYKEGKRYPQLGCDW